MVAFQAVRVPQELQPVKASVLEEYVQARLHQVVAALAQKLSTVYSNVKADVVELSAAEVARALPGPRYEQMPLENMHLQLVFRHDCLALGCLDPQCILCQHNPQRRCTTNFDRKYLVNDPLKAKCSAIIRVELIDRFTGNVVHEDVPDLKLEMNILDGNLYQTKFLEAGKTDRSNTEELNSCALLLDNKQQPLLVCGSGGSNDAEGKVVLSLQKGRAELPDLRIIRSSEALLSGRKPPFRLLVRAVVPDVHSLHIHHAVSEAFVVATRRTRTCGKADIPSIDDHVSKLEHMGRETVRKLYDLRTAAQQAGVQIEIPENCVQKVGEFKQLSLRAEQDGHLRQKLLHVLKLSKEKWDQTTEHAMKAVAADNHMRAWYTDPTTMETGLLYTCRLGIIDLSRPVGLLTRRVDNGEPKIEATLMPQQTPAQRETVRHLSSTALQSWYISGHPGWAMFPMDSEAYLQRNELVPSQPTGEGPPVPPPQSPHPHPSSPRPSPHRDNTPPQMDIHMTDVDPPPAHYHTTTPHPSPIPSSTHPSSSAPPHANSMLKAESPDNSILSEASKTPAALSEVSPFANTQLQSHVAQSTGSLARGAAQQQPPGSGPMALVALPHGLLHPSNPFLDMARRSLDPNAQQPSAPLGSLPLLSPPGDIPSASSWFHSSLLGSLANILPLQGTSQQDSQPNASPAHRGNHALTANGGNTPGASGVANGGNTGNLPSINLSHLGGMFDHLPSFGPGAIMQSADIEGMLSNPGSFNFDKAGNSLMLFARSGSLKMEHSMEFPSSLESGSGSGDSKGSDLQTATAAAAPSPTQS